MLDRSRRLVAAVGAAVLLGGCGGTTDPAGRPQDDTEQDGTGPAAGATSPGPADPQDAARYPDVVGVELVPEGGDLFNVEVTMSSPYDTPDRYADAWRVLAGDEQLAVRELLHDHAGEQPFTRSLGGVKIPEGVAEVTVEGRDLANGWGGGTLTVDVPGR